MQNRSFVGLTLAAALTGLTASASHAQGILTVPSHAALTHSVRNDGTYSIGYLFTVGPNAVTVDDLGFYIYNSALIATHTVAIYDTSGNLVLGETGPATVGPSATKSADGFGYVPVTPFMLSAKTQYLIGASTTQNDGDPFLQQYETYAATPGSGIASIDNAQYNTDPTKAPLSSGGGGQAYAGPSFITGAAPEPSEFAGLGLGVLGLAGMALAARKRRTSAV